MPDLLLMNGPNLGRLGKREPHIYGHTTLLDIEKAVRGRAEAAGYGLRAVQNDCEGELIRALDRNRDAAGLVLNPGALMMAGWSLRDALADFDPPWVEVHISNVWARESFRHVSVLSPLALGVISGFGAHGYILGVDALVTALADTADRAEHR
jgi:5-deoxy-5-amino-3-dehydroquinate dehydratase